MGIFTDKTAIVTGGASGIGKALCEELARRGAKVIIADINIEPAKIVAEDIRQSGDYAESTRLDVRDFEAVKKLVDDTVAAHGKLDYIFNNAGIAIFAEARDYEYRHWKDVLDINLYGPVNGVAAAYPVMLKQGFGHIVSTASLAGLMPADPLVSYCTAKHGVVGMSTSLRIEAAALGVKVSVVCPGLIQTPMYNSPTININKEKLLDDAPEGLPPEKCAKVILRGVEKNKAIIVVTNLAKIAWILNRISPSMMEFLAKLFMIKFRKDLRVE